MSRVTGLFVIAVLLLGSSPKREVTDAQIRDLLIAESRSSYAKRCPCPYDADARRRRCGKRSAYSKPGGEKPLCYHHDVTAEMIDAFRKRAAEESSAQTATHMAANCQHLDFD